MPKVVSERLWFHSIGLFQIREPVFDDFSSIFSWVRFNKKRLFIINMLSVISGLMAETISLSLKKTSITDGDNALVLKKIPTPDECQNTDFDRCNKVLGDWQISCFEEDRNFLKKCIVPSIKKAFDQPKADVCHDAAGFLYKTIDKLSETENTIFYPGESPEVLFDLFSPCLVRKIFQVSLCYTEKESGKQKITHDMVVIRSGNVYRLYQAFAGHYTLNDLVHGNTGYLSEKANERSSFVQTYVKKSDKTIRVFQEIIDDIITDRNDSYGDGTDLDLMFNFQQVIDRLIILKENVKGCMGWVEENIKKLNLNIASKHSRGMVFEDFKNNILVPLHKICKEKDTESYKAISGVSTSFSEKEKNGLFYLVIKSAPIKEHGQE